MKENTGLKEPLVSVVVPTYNRQDTIIRALDSIVKQTFSDFEIIIVDDCSRDNTVTCINEYKYKDKIRLYILEKNSGANAARNKGIEMSVGKYIAFLDSDDVWDEAYLEEMVDTALNENKNLVCSSFFVVDEKNIVHENLCKIKKDYIYRDEIYGDIMSPTSCVMVNKQTIVDCGLFDTSMPARQDYDMWLRITKEHTVGIVRKCLVTVYWDTHLHIGSNYKNYVVGTLKIVKKLVESNDLTAEEKKAVCYFHYIAIAKVYANNGCYTEAKKYAKMALKNKVSIKVLVFIILFYMPVLYKWLRAIKNSNKRKT